MATMTVAEAHTAAFKAAIPEAATADVDAAHMTAATAHVAPTATHVATTAHMTAASSKRQSRPAKNNSSAKRSSACQNT
jgi:hypothetical protein